MQHGLTPKKDRSPFWFACYSLPDGRRTQRSTGTVDKRKALTIALKYEDASREALRHAATTLLKSAGVSDAVDGGTNRVKSWRIEILCPLP